MSDVAIAYKQLWEKFGKNKTAAYLDYKFTPTHRTGLFNYLRERQVIRYLAAKKTDVVLDAGCAAGRQVFRVVPYVAEAYGVDIAQSFIDGANAFKKQRGIVNAHFACALGEELPYPDGKFDAVLCLEVFEHVFDKEVTLDGLMRVLKPGGRLVVSVPHLNADGTLWGQWCRFIGARKFVPINEFSLEELAKHGDAHVREFTPVSIREWLESRGLKVEDVTTVGCLAGPGGSVLDFFLKAVLHISPLRWLFIRCDQLGTALGLPGRGIVLKAIKK